MNKLIIAVFFLASMACSQHGLAKSGDSPLHKAVASAHRDPAYRLRDQYRHPEKALTFFGLKPGMTIVEIWPGTGWWTEILGPYTHESGVYFAAGFSMTAKRDPDWRKQMHVEFTNKLADSPEHYGHIVVTEFSIPERTTIAPANSADRVLTFRNVHNWMKGGYADVVFAVMYRVLKPGGVLGLVEHRAKPGTSVDDMIESGYVTERHVIKLAEQAGFRLAAKSEINANPKDTANHPAGVWTLPPTLRFCKSQSEHEQAACYKKYREIGESDRMTLRFIKE